VKQLLQKGVDTSVKSNTNKTPLQYAAQAGHKSIVKLILESELNAREVKKTLSNDVLSPAHEASNQEKEKETKEVFNQRKQGLEALSQGKDRSNDINTQKAYMSKEESIEEAITENNVHFKNDVVSTELKSSGEINDL
jgi:ankyrin repeat protein